MQRSVVTGLDTQVEVLLQQVEDLKKAVTEKDAELVKVHQATLQIERVLMESYSISTWKGRGKGGREGRH